MAGASAAESVGDLFRREFAHLVAALARLLGPSHLALAEDVVQDALISAMQAWRFGPPDDPKGWILQVAKRRAIDLIRRDRRFDALCTEHAAEWKLEGAVDTALSPEADAQNQLSMMFAICDEALSSETHVTLILRWLCGLSPSEIARAFLVDVSTIDRRLHRGRLRLKELGGLRDINFMADVRSAQSSIERALYLLFNEGYHGSDEETPLQPSLCAEAIRLAELLLGAPGTERSTTHALAALFYFNAARLTTRLDVEGVVVPLDEQDRTRWDRALIERGVQHLGGSATGDHWTKWHLEAAIAFEHTIAPSVAETNWDKIVAYYDALMDVAPGPVVALNRGLALAELRGLDAGREALAPLAGESRFAAYSFYWAALADIERRAGRLDEAKALYQRAGVLAKSRAERTSYERRIKEFEVP